MNKDFLETRVVGRAKDADMMTFQALGGQTRVTRKSRLTGATPQEWDEAFKED